MCQNRGVEMCSLGGGKASIWGVEMCQIWGVEMCRDEVIHNHLKQRKQTNADLLSIFYYVVQRQHLDVYHRLIYTKADQSKYPIIHQGHQGHQG